MRIFRWALFLLLVLSVSCNTETNSDSKIGKEGGKISLEDGTTLQVPKGTLDKTLRFLIIKGGSVEGKDLDEGEVATGPWISLQIKNENNEDYDSISNFTQGESYQLTIPIPEKEKENSESLYIIINMGESSFPVFGQVENGELSIRLAGLTNGLKFALVKSPNFQYVTKKQSLKGNLGIKTQSLTWKGYKGWEIKAGKGVWSFLVKEEDKNQIKKSFNDASAKLSSSGFSEPSLLKKNGYFEATLIKMKRNIYGYFDVPYLNKQRKISPARITGTLYINVNKIGDPLFKTTIFHELYHAVSYKYGYYNSAPVWCSGNKKLFKTTNPQAAWKGANKGFEEGMALFLGFYFSDAYDPTSPLKLTATTKEPPEDHWFHLLSNGFEIGNHCNTPTQQTYSMGDFFAYIIRRYNDGKISFYVDLLNDFKLLGFSTKTMNTAFKKLKEPVSLVEAYYNFTRHRAYEGGSTEDTIKLSNGTSIVASQLRGDGKDVPLYLQDGIKTKDNLREGLFDKLEGIARITLIKARENKTFVNLKTFSPFSTKVIRIRKHNVEDVDLLIDFQNAVIHDNQGQEGFRVRVFYRDSLGKTTDRFSLKKNQLTIPFSSGKIEEAILLVIYTKLTPETEEGNGTSISISYKSLKSCPNPCSSGKKRCTSEEKIQTCSMNRTTNCLEWGTPNDCPTGQSCLQGKCTNKTDPCVQICKGFCGSYQGCQCENCSTGEYCDNNNKCSPCPNPCAKVGATRCDADGKVQTCSMNRITKCLNWSQFQDCSQGKYCPETSCITKPTITSISPLRATLDQKTTFTVIGTDLPKTLAAYIQSCENLKFEVATTSTKAIFSCTPKRHLGLRSGEIKNKSKGFVLHTFNITVTSSQEPVQEVISEPSNPEFYADGGEVNFERINDASETIPEKNQEFIPEVKPLPCINSKLSHSISSHNLKSVAWSPDGKMIATGATDKTIKLWDIATGKPIKSFSSSIDLGKVLAWSPDGKMIATGATDKTIKLWDIATGKVTHTLIGFTTVVTSIVFSPDSKTLAAGSYDKTIRLWSSSTGTLLKSITIHTKETLGASLAFSPDGKTLASGFFTLTKSGLPDYGAIKLWEVTTGKIAQTIKSSIVYSVAFSPDGKTIASGSKDSIYLWEVATGKILKTLSGQLGLVTNLMFHSNSKILSGGSLIRIWDLSTNKIVKTMNNSAGSNHIAWSPDKKTIVASQSNTIRIWNATTALVVESFSGMRSVNTVVISPDGKTLASGSNDKAIRLWEVATGKLLQTFWGPSGEQTVYSLKFSPDGKILAAGYSSGNITIWTIATKKLLFSLSHPNVRSLSFHFNGKMLASGGWDKKIRLWEVATGKLLQTYTLSNPSIFAAVYTVAWSPNGKVIASGYGDKKIRLWEVATGKLLKTLSENDGELYISWNPDGKIIASGSGDKSVKLWDVSTGKLLQDLPISGFRIQVKSVSFSSNGKTLASGSDDKKIRLWSCP